MEEVLDEILTVMKEINLNLYEMKLDLEECKNQLIDIKVDLQQVNDKYLSE